MELFEKYRHILTLTIVIIIVALIIFALFVFQGREFQAENNVTKTVQKILYPTEVNGFESLFAPYKEDVVKKPTINVIDEKYRSEVENVAKVISAPNSIKIGLEAKKIGEYKKSKQQKSIISDMELLETF